MFTAEKILDGIIFVVMSAKFYTVLKFNNCVQGVPINMVYFLWLVDQSELSTSYELLKMWADFFKLTEI